MSPVSPLQYQIAQCDFSILTVKQRVLVELWGRGGIAISFSIPDIIPFVYGRTFHGREYTIKYNIVLHKLQRLIANQMVRRILGTNPIAYQLMNTERTRNYIRYVFRTYFDIDIPDSMFRRLL